MVFKLICKHALYCRSDWYVQNTKRRGGWFFPFRISVPFWEQITQIPSNMSPKRDCGPKRANSSHATIFGMRAHVPIYQIPGTRVSFSSGGKRGCHQRARRHPWDLTAKKNLCGGGGGGDAGGCWPTGAAENLHLRARLSRFARIVFYHLAPCSQLVR